MEKCKGNKNAYVVWKKKKKIKEIKLVIILLSN
jgi:hypothetical protein